MCCNNYRNTYILYTRMRDAAPMQTFQQWSALHSQLLWAYEGTVAADALHHLGVRHPESLSAWLILKGSVRLASGSTTLRVRRNQWVFFSGQFVKQDFSPAARVLSLNFRIQGAAMPHHAPVIVLSEEHSALERAARKIIVLLEKILPGVRNELSSQSLTQLEFYRVASRFAHWMEEYFKARVASDALTARHQHVDNRVSKVLERLTFESLAHSAPMSSLAQSVGLTTGHLDRLFVQEFGATPRRMREIRRREEARQRVAHSDVPFKQIAYELGFSSPAHFSNWFRSCHKISPRACRRQQHG